MMAQRLSPFLHSLFLVVPMALAVVACSTNDTTTGDGGTTSDGGIDGGDGDGGDSDGGAPLGGVVRCAPFEGVAGKVGDPEFGSDAVALATYDLTSESTCCVGLAKVTSSSKPRIVRVGLDTGLHHTGMAPTIPEGIALEKSSSLGMSEGKIVACLVDDDTGGHLGTIDPGSGAVAVSAVPCRGVTAEGQRIYVAPAEVSVPVSSFESYASAVAQEGATSWATESGASRFAANATHLLSAWHSTDTVEVLALAGGDPAVVVLEGFDHWVDGVDILDGGSVVVSTRGPAGQSRLVHFGATGKVERVLDVPFAGPVHGVACGTGTDYCPAGATPPEVTCVPFDATTEIVAGNAPPGGGDGGMPDGGEAPLGPQPDLSGESACCTTVVVPSSGESYRLTHVGLDTGAVHHRAKIGTSEPVNGVSSLGQGDGFVYLCLGSTGEAVAARVTLASGAVEQSSLPCAAVTSDGGSVYVLTGQVLKTYATWADVMAGTSSASHTLTGSVSRVTVDTGLA
ncbi:MAG: hypothetical protein KC416_03855, partial [Myxococcales bacterium]|nr:hypothetical protein [Myxococcales bacterium]